MRHDKRGLSPIIATVLIIMISVAAIALLAGFLVPFVKNSLQRSTECVPYAGYYVFDESFSNCANVSDNSYFISIKSSFDRELAKNVDGLKIVFTKENGESKVLEIKNDSSGEGVSMLSDPQSNLRLPGPGGVVTYVYNTSAEDKFSSAEVYPILKDGRICADTKELINIKTC